MIISAIKSKDVSDKRSVLHPETIKNLISKGIEIIFESGIGDGIHVGCLLYTSDAADDL